MPLGIEKKKILLCLWLKKRKKHNQKFTLIHEFKKLNQYEEFLEVSVLAVGYSRPRDQLMPLTSKKMTGCHAISHRIQSNSCPYRTCGRSHGLLNKRFRSTFSLQYGHVCFLPMIHQPRMQNSWNTWWHDSLNVFSRTPSSFSLTNSSFPQTAHVFSSKLRNGIPVSV